MAPVDEVVSGLLIAVLIVFIVWMLVREHRIELEEARRNLDRPSSFIDAEYLSAIDAAVDEVAARRALRPHGQVENVVPLHSRKRGPAA